MFWWMNYVAGVIVAYAVYLALRLCVTYDPADAFLKNSRVRALRKMGIK